MKVNEIFYSIQGEGYYSGTAATFIRFAGCNLKCSFCDTNHKDWIIMPEDEIINVVSENPAELVVITGGEPTIQLTKTLIDKLHAIRKYVAIETNGTRPVLSNIDWVTVSPKQGYVGEIGHPVIKHANEVKVVYDGIHQISNFGIQADYYYIQPCDTGDNKRNKEIIKQCVEFIKKNPKWRLSLQTQKILNVR